MLQADDKSGPVVAAGRRSVAELFPRDPARSPYDIPQRSLFAGLFHGVRPGTTFSYGVREMLLVTIAEHAPRLRELINSAEFEPLTGQGANVGSACAWIAAEMIAAGGPYDVAFAQAAADRMWAEAAGPVTEWTNAFLQPPADHVIGLLAAAATRPEVADLVLELFSDPARNWKVLSSPDEVNRLVDALV